MENMPTKRNLILAKQNLTLARKGHDLLEIKLGALLRELKRAEKTARELREKIEKIFSSAQRARVFVEIEIGRELADEIFARDWNLEKIPYTLTETCVVFDEAFLAWKKIFLLQKELSEIETEIARQKARATRIKKRAAALRNVTIPAYEQRVKHISVYLEEHERDEMVRIRSLF